MGPSEKLLKTLQSCSAMHVYTAWLHLHQYLDVSTWINTLLLLRQREGSLVGEALDDENTVEPKGGGTKSVI
jgi:hypothetical protein